MENRRLEFRSRFIWERIQRKSCLWNSPHGFFRIREKPGRAHQETPRCIHGWEIPGYLQRVKPSGGIPAIPEALKEKPGIFFPPFQVEFHSQFHNMDPNIGRVWPLLPLEMEPRKIGISSLNPRKTNAGIWEIPASPRGPEFREAELLKLWDFPFPAAKKMKGSTSQRFPGLETELLLRSSGWD